MKRYAKYSTFLILLVAVGCATLGIQPQTFNQRLAVAYSSVSAVRATATGLVTSGKISPDDATNVQKQADNAREGADLARSLHATNPTAGETKLSSAIAILNTLETYLKGRQ